MQKDNEEKSMQASTLQRVRLVGKDAEGLAEDGLGVAQPTTVGYRL